MFTDAEVQFVKDTFPTIEFRHNVWGRRMHGADLVQGVEVYVEQMVDGRFACGHKSTAGHFWGYGTSVRVAVWEVLDRLHKTSV